MKIREHYSKYQMNILSNFFIFISLSIIEVKIICKFVQNFINFTKKVTVCMEMPRVAYTPIDLRQLRAEDSLRNQVGLEGLKTYLL